MLDYKIVQNNTVIGVCTSSDLRVFQQKHQILLLCYEDDAQYICVDDRYYHDMWMKPITTDKVPYEMAEVVVIEEEEYERLKALLDDEEEVVEETPEEPPVEEPVEEPSPEPEERVLSRVELMEQNKAMQTQIDMLTECLLEVSMMLYA